MKPKDYRKQVEAEIAARNTKRRAEQAVLHDTAASAREHKRVLESLPAFEEDAEIARAKSMAVDKSLDPDVRARAIANLSIAVTNDSLLVTSMLATVSDASEPKAVRLAALGVLQQASFQPKTWAALRPKLLPVLRSIASDPDADLRLKVLGILAREKDGDTQRRLLEGLRDPQKALIPPAKALQYLGYDIHSGAIDAAREIVDAPPDSDSRMAALRILAADAGSRDRFVALLQDKKESAEVRRLAIAALHTIDPKALQTFARACAVDATEDESVRAACVAALTSFGDEKALANDEELKARVDEMARSSISDYAKQGADQFLKKHGR